MTKTIVAREQTSTTKTNNIGDGYWESYSIMTDRVLYDGETEWVEESVDAKAIDSDPQQAIMTAMSATLNYIFQNAYKNGFSGLVEYREYERSLEDGSPAVPNVE